MSTILIVGGADYIARAILLANEHAVLTLDEGMEIPKPDAADPLPVWVAIFPVGVTRHRGDFPDGRIEFNRAFAEKMLANWQAAGKPRRPINYFHRGSTVDGDLTPIEQKVAAGWMSDFKITARDDGKMFVWALTTWTPKARAHILADELCCVSPEFAVDGLNKATGKGQGPTLYGAALLNDPYLEELPRVAAADNPHAAPAAGAEQMDKAKLIALLGLAATATEADIEKALEQQKTDLADAKAKLADATGKVSLAESGTTKLMAERDDARQQVTTLSARLAEVETAAKVTAIDAYLSERVKVGVMSPGMVPGVRSLALAQGLPAVKAIYDAAPKVVELGERGVGAAAGSGNAATGPEAHQKFTALMDEAQKTGLSATQAWAKVSRENPELAAAAAELPKSKPVTA